MGLWPCNSFSGNICFEFSTLGLCTAVFYTATAIPLIYSFSGNCTASAPNSTFMCLWAIYKFPGSVCIFPPAEKWDPSWKYIISSQTHECGNWDWDPDIPFLGIFVSNFRHFVFAVYLQTTSIQIIHISGGLCSWPMPSFSPWSSLSSWPPSTPPQNWGRAWSTIS